MKQNKHLQAKRSNVNENVSVNVNENEKVTLILLLLHRAITAFENQNVDILKIKHAYSYILKPKILR